jgi:hypothetical protein
MSLDAATCRPGEQECLVHRGNALLYCQQYVTDLTTLRAQAVREGVMKTVMEARDATIEALDECLEGEHHFEVAKRVSELRAALIRARGPQA